jgi:hypothetical protein
MPERDLRDWRTPVLPKFFPSGGLAHDTGDDTLRETLVMAFEEGDPAIDLLLRGEVCTNCAYRMPAPPSKASLHLFRMEDYPYEPHVVRDLIRNRRCPVCRCEVTPEIAQNMMTGDKWSRQAVERETRAHREAAEQDERERARHAAKKAGA